MDHAAAADIGQDAIRRHHLARLSVAKHDGLGKTNEATSVALKMMLRHRMRSILIVYTASLKVQWQQEVRAKFGLEFRVVDYETVSQFCRKCGIHANPWAHFPWLITSVDFLKHERPLCTFRGLQPRSHSVRGAAAIGKLNHCVAAALNRLVH